MEIRSGCIKIPLDRMSAKTNRILRYMCTLLVGKLESRCVANYTLKKTTIDHKAKSNHDIIDVVHKKLLYGRLFRIKQGY